MGYVIVVILSDGSEKRIPYIESQLQTAEKFLEILLRHNFVAWLAPA